MMLHNEAFLAPVSLETFGMHNLGKMVTRAMIPLCVASGLGPIIMWNGLSKSGNIYIDQSKNTSEVQMSILLNFAGNTLLILASIALCAFISFAFFVKPHVYQGKA